MSKSQLPSIIIFYHDIGEQSPTLLRQSLTVQRVVKNVQPIDNPYPGQKAEQGVIRYRGKDVPVYRNTTFPTLGHIWYTTNKEKALAGIKAVRL